MDRGADQNHQPDPATPEPGVKWNIRKILLGTALSLLILLACFALGLLPLNLFFLKTTINEVVREHTGAELIIEGPLRLKLGWSPQLTAGQMTLGFPEMAQQPSVFINDVSVRTRLRSVLHGDIDLSNVKARGIAIDPGSAEPGIILPEKLTLDAAAPLDQVLSIQINGQLGGDALSVSLTGASLDDLLNASSEYPFEAELNAVGSALQAQGVLLLPWSAPGFAGSLTADSSDLSALLMQFGQEVATLGQLSAKADIQLSESAIQIDSLEGDLDGFAFVFSGMARDWSSRLWFELNAHLPLLDLAALPGVSKETAPDEAGNKLELQVIFDQLSGFDGQAEITVEQVQNAPVPMEELAITASLREGRLVVENAAGKISGTEFSAQASLDTTEVCAQLDTSIRVATFDLETLAPYLGEDADLAGKLDDGWIKTSSCGASFEHHLHSLQTAITVAGLELTGLEDHPPLLFGNIEAEVNWQQANRISFESELMEEPLAVAFKFGSIEQLKADALWPVEFSARSKTYGLEFSGLTAIQESGLIVDLSLNGYLGNSDVGGTLAWSGKGGGKPLEVSLHANLLDLVEIDSLLPEIEGEVESKQDWTELLDQNDLLENWLDAPNIDVNLTVNQLHGTRFDFSNASLSARLEDKKLEKGRMRLVYEGIQLEGVLNSDMSNRTWLVDYQGTLKNLDIGRVLKSLDISDDVHARTERVDFLFESEGSTFGELARNIRINTSLQAFQWAFTAGPENREFEINLSDLSLKAIPGSGAVWETTGSLNGSPINAWLKTPSLRTTFDKNQTLPARLVVGTNSGLTMLDVVIQPESEIDLNSRIRISGRHENAGNIDFATLPVPLEDFSFSTDLTIKKKEYLASDIKLSVGSSNATGLFKIEPSGQGFHFTLEADSPLLETDDLVRWTEEFREVSEIISAPESVSTDSESMNVGVITLVDQYFDEFIGDNSWSVRLNINELRSGGKLLGETEIGLEMDSQHTILEPATIRLPGGNVVASYRAQQLTSGWDYDFEVYVESLEYGGVLRLFDPETTVDGKIHVKTSLHSRAEGPADALNHLEGTVDLAVFPDDIGAQFLDLWAANVVFAMLPFGDNQTKKMNCMVARFDVEEGVMTSRDTFLDSTDIIVRARGEIDLANQQLDLLAIPQAKVEKFLSISTPIAVTGPFDDFSAGVATGGFVMTVMRWYYGLIYVPWKWLTGERYPADGIATCFRAMDWDLPEEAK